MIFVLLCFVYTPCDREIGLARYQINNRLKNQISKRIRGIEMIERMVETATKRDV